MIQTQLLRLDPPYQIISYGGEVALHVATLIVTQETTDAKGKTKLETHCRPVVNYSRKEYFIENPQQLVRHLHFGMSPISGTPHMKGEGTIWDEADVANVTVLGIAGTTTELDWIALAHPLSYAKDPDDFHYRLRRHLVCLRDLGIGVKGYEPDTVEFIVDAYNADNKHVWTDMYLDKCLVYSARAKSMKAAKEAWIEVATVIHKMLLGANSSCSISGAAWREDEALEKLASEASDELWLLENPKPDGKVQD